VVRNSSLPSLLVAILITVPIAAQTTGTAVARQVARVRAADQRGAFKADWNSLAAYRTPIWFQDAKFGIFIHWGVYSVPAFGNEWYSRNMYVPGNKAFDHQIATYGPQSKFGYKDFIPMFRAERFNATEWVDLFAKSGARYVVPVAEHCDGFAMYDSHLTDWTAMKMGPKRDILGELAVATRARGLHFGASSHRAEHWWWYGLGRTFNSDVNDPKYAGLYGPAAKMALPGTADDTKEPDPNHFEQWLPPDKPFLDDWLARTTEIVDKYHPEFIYIDWWDGQPAFEPYLKEFAAYFYNSSKAIGEKPVLTYKIEAMPANTATLDIERGKMDTTRLLPWQTDTSVSIHSWGYVEHDEYRTAQSLVQQLVDTVSKNGNLLLNIGPKADGTIPDEARTVLLQIGDWLRVNGEAIYNTRPFAVFGEGPTKGPKNSQAKSSDIQAYTAADIRFTVPKAGGGLVYATVLGWPTTDTLRIQLLGSGLPYLAHPVCSVSLIGTNAELMYSQKPDGLFISLPATHPDEVAYVFKVKTLCGDNAK